VLLGAGRPVTLANSEDGARLSGAPTKSQCGVQTPTLRKAGQQTAGGWT
jgi:hypothetical protein